MLGLIGLNKQLFRLFYFQQLNFKTMYEIVNLQRSIVAGYMNVYVKKSGETSELPYTEVWLIELFLMPPNIKTGDKVTYKFE